MNNDQLKQAFDWCEKNGSAEDWDLLAIAYYSAGCHMNALAYFKKADRKRETRFELKENDGKTHSQVLVYDPSDLKYWTEQCKKTGHKLVLLYRVDADALGYPDPAHDVYQVAPVIAHNSSEPLDVGIYT